MGGLPHSGKEYVARTHAVNNFASVAHVILAITANYAAILVSFLRGVLYATQFLPSLLHSCKTLTRSIQYIVLETSGSSFKTKE